MRSWAEGGGTIDIGGLVPELAETAGLTVEYFSPVARLGGVGSLEWRWIAEFFRGYLPKLAERGAIEVPEVDAFDEEWTSREEQGRSYAYTPTMVDVVLRKP